MVWWDRGGGAQLPTGGLLDSPLGGCVFLSTEIKMNKEVTKLVSLQPLPGLPNLVFPDFIAFPYLQERCGFFFLEFLGLENVMFRNVSFK